MKEQELNQKLALLLKRLNINKLMLTSVGNSIASGYSIVRTTKPLFLRNETLKKYMEENKIELETHAYARPQNNNEEHVFEWIIENTKESEINEMLRSDYSGSETSMNTNLLTQEMVEREYPIDLENNKGLQDILKQKEEGQANIVVYNGCTGSLLDNLTREGKLTEQLAYGIKRDVVGLEAILKYIQTINRKENTNTQVYVCGAPNFLGLNLMDMINKRIKKAVKNYANVTYVEPVKSNFIYRNVETNKISPDIHYNEEEYKELNEHIIKSILDNYIINQAMINIDRKLYNLSSDIEINHPELSTNNDKIQDYIDDILLTEEVKIQNKEDKEKFLKKAKDYILERSPYDFFYLKKENINESIERRKYN